MPRDKIKLESSAGTGHFYTTSKNKKNMPDKMEIKKFDPVARKHVHVQGNEAEVAAVAAPLPRPLLRPFTKEPASSGFLRRSHSATWQVVPLRSAKRPIGPCPHPRSSFERSDKMNRRSHDGRRPSIRHARVRAEA